MTHSMGGLVARHCSEVREWNKKILGIVHSVMPAIGSATAYKRVKSGWEPGSSIEDAIARKILGATGAEITAVFAQSPGPLQLLPDANYGNGWLKIRDGDRFETLPKECDPYGEIYTKRGQWWGLIDDRLIDSRDTKNENIDIDWGKFEILIKEHVFPFQEAISGRYHGHTYAFYGDDNEHKTWGDVVWRRTPHKAKEGLHNRVNLDEASIQRPMRLPITPYTARTP